MDKDRASRCNKDEESPTNLSTGECQIQDKVCFSYENDWSILSKNLSIDLHLAVEKENAMEECSDGGKEVIVPANIKDMDSQRKIQTVNIPKSSPVSMIPTGKRNTSFILAREVPSLNSIRQDSIVDLYCDDELRMSLEFDEHHLGLGLSEELAIYDLLDDDLLPTTMTKNLEESLEEMHEDWEEDDVDSATPTRKGMRKGRKEGERQGSQLIQ